MDIRKKKEKHIDPAQDDPDAVGDAWIWKCIKPPTRVRVVSYVGKHTLDDAREFIGQMKARSDGQAPLLFSDELRS